VARKRVEITSQGLDVDPVRTASILARTASAPVRAYFDAGLNVTLCTDGWLMAGVSLSDEYWLAYTDLDAYGLYVTIDDRFVRQHRVVLRGVVEAAQSFNDAKPRQTLIHSRKRLTQRLDASTAVATFVDLVKRKVSIPRTPEPDLSDRRIGQLERQLEAQLRPVLREQEFQQFDLARAVETLRRIKANMDGSRR
jgi:hypothetical protein